MTRTVPTRPETPAPTPSPPPPSVADHRRRFGAWGEGVAARHLGRQGMVLLDHNWRCEAGEIDLVLRDGRVLVICEVKTRRSAAFGHPLAAVDAVKVARLRRLAARWLRTHDVRADDLRIDIVGVLAPHDGPVEVEHVAGVG